MHYIMDKDGNPVKVTVYKSIAWMAENGSAIKSINETRHNDGALTSTTFLGMDYSWNENSDVPILFETMIFPESYDDEGKCPLEGYQFRAETREDALSCHEAAVKLYEEWLKDLEEEKLDKIAGEERLQAILNECTFETESSVKLEDSW